MKRILGMGVVVVGVAAAAWWFSRGGQPPGTAVPQEAAAVAASRSAGGQTPLPDRTPPPPSARALIHRALVEGKIDYATSLAYRAYALFRDERLPAQFRAGASSDEDQALFAEARQNLSQLPPETQALLRGYLVRPADPSSAFAPAPRQARSAGLGDLLAVHAAELPCQTGWKTQRSSSIPIRVWAQCTEGDDEGDIAKALRMLEEVYGPMTNLMGLPRLDLDAGATPAQRFLAAGDEAIDVYLVTLPGDAPGGRSLDLTAQEAAGWAVSTDACDGVRCSAYAAVQRGVDDDELRVTLIHEFFHVLQYAHNTPILFLPIPAAAAAGGLAHREYWFVEASAQWAEAHFARALAREKVHDPEFVGGFQLRREPLHSSDADTDIYQAYIWPFFLEQERGPASIARIWGRLRDGAARDWNTALDAIDAELPFSEHFREFARRNLNHDFDGQKPIPKLYDALDPGFPTGPGTTPPTFVPGSGGRVIVASDTPEVLALDPIVSLKAQYFHFTVDDDVRQLVFDVSGLQDSTDLDVDAVVRDLDEGGAAPGRWQLVSLASGEPRLRFCRDWPGEKVEEVVLLLANHNKDETRSVTGALQIEALATPCACGTVDIVTNGTVITSEVTDTGTTTGRRTKLQKDSGGFTVIMDDAGRVSSRGSSTTTIDDKAAGHNAFAGPSHRNVSHRLERRLLNDTGSLKLSRIREDGTYVLQVCIAPMETTDRTNVDTSAPGGSHSTTTTEVNENPTCYTLNGTVGSDRRVLRGRNHSPVVLQAGPAASQQNVRSYSTRMGPTLYTGSADGGWTATWQLGECAPRGR